MSDIFCFIKLVKRVGWIKPVLSVRRAERIHLLSKTEGEKMQEVCHIVSLPFLYTLKRFVEPACPMGTPPVMATVSSSVI